MSEYLHSYVHQSMNYAIQRIFLLFISIFFIETKVYAQCSPNEIEFVGGERIYNTACGNSSYQQIKGSKLTGVNFRWEFSYSGSAFQTIVNSSNVPISSSDLAASDITNFILNINVNKSGDYRIRRIAIGASCMNESEPVFLYYAENQSQLSGGDISNLSTINCAPASGILFLSGQTGPVLQWETSVDGVNWTIIANNSNTLNYNNISSATYYRALVDNICNGSPGIIDPLDKYSNIFLLSLTYPPTVTSPISTTICEGSDLILSVTATSAINISYQWRKDGIPIPGANSETLNIPNAGPSDAGNYDVLVSNACGTTNSSTAIVNVKPAPLVNPLPNNIEVCAGTTIPITNFTSSTPGVTYSWTNSNAAIGLGSNGSGNFSFTATNPGTSPISATINIYAEKDGCTGPATTFTIEVEPLPQATVTATNQSRCDVNDGTITVSTVSTSAVVYSIDGGTNFVNNGGNFTGLAAGNYSVVIKNSLGCASTAVPVTIANPPVTPKPTLIPISSTICEGDPITLSISPSSDPNTIYTWTGPSGFNAIGSSINVTNSATTAMSGNYSVTASLNSCVSLPTSINISVNPKPVLSSLSIPSNQTYCAGQSIPAIALNSIPSGAIINWTNSDPAIGLASNGTGDIPSFIASNTSNSPISSTIKITPVLNGCAGPEYSFNITINPTPKVNVPSDIIVCTGEIITSTNFASSISGTTFRWTNTNASIGYPLSGTGDLPSIFANNTSNAPITASITVIPTLNGCDGPAKTYNITVNPKAVISVSKIDESACGADNGQITISATGTGPFEYSIDDGLNFISNGGIFTGLTVGSYTVAVKNNFGCITKGPSVSINSPGAPPTPILVADNSTICEGENFRIKIDNFDPSVNYKWTGPDGYININNDQEISISSANILKSGNYIVTASIGNCISISSINIKVNPKPIINSIFDQTYCAGATVPDIIFNSNLPGTTYEWTNSNPTIGLAANGSNNINFFTAVNTTNTVQTAIITVTPESLDGCIGLSTTLTININPIPVLIQPVVVTVCAGNTVSSIIFSSSVAGTTYKWRNDNPSIGLATNGSGDIGSFTAINTTSTNQTAIIEVTPIFDNCEGIPKTFKIIVKPLPRITNSVLQQNSCSGNNTTAVTFTSDIVGTTYNWTAIPNANLLGYQASGSGNIPIQNIINSTINDEILSYEITPSVNGCAGTPIIYKILVNPLPTATLSGSTNLCFGASATLSVNLTGKAPWAISYTDGTSSNTISGIGTNNYTFNVNPNGTKTYTITSVSDANSCNNTGLGSATIQQPTTPITANVNSTNISCFGANDGTISVINLSGGFGTYEFSIDLGSTWQTSPIFSNLSPGTYTIYVRDALLSGCTVILSPNVTISQASAPLGLTFIKTNVSCQSGSDGSIKITASGGTAPYTYIWSTGETSDIINNLSVGDYTVQIKDAKGCIYSELIKIEEPLNPIKINYSKLNPSCFGDTNGAIDLQISGGTTPYTFNWSNAETTEDLANLSGNNTYTVIVKDANDCTATESITITQPNELKVTFTVQNTTCKFSADGKISAVIQGGTLPYTLEWLGSGLTTSSIDNLAAGRYDLRVRDANGCSTIAFTNVIAGICPPVALDDDFSTYEEVPISESVALNDYDKQAESLNFYLINGALNGNLIFNIDGTFTYTPNPGFEGTETIDYKTCNTSGLCATAQLIIKVIPYTVVSLKPKNSTVSEGKKVTISATLLRPFKDDVTIKLGYSGVAINNKDYKLFDQFIEIKIEKGQVNTTEKITIAALSDGDLEGDENIQINIISTSDPLVIIGTGASVIIEDNFPTSGSIPTNENNKYPENPDIIPDPLVSPNDDGLGNDYFKIDNIISFPENQVQIFNRWGNEVFKMEDYNDTDRVFKGYANTGLLTNTNKQLSDGVYYYLITTKRYILGQQVNMLNKGYLILKR